MKQEVIKSFGPLTNLGTNILGGLTQLEEILGIVHVPKIKIETDLLALVTSNTEYQNSRVLFSDRRVTWRALAKEGRELVMLLRDVYKPRLGSQFSIHWVVFGFQDNLEAPTLPGDVKLFLRATHTHLAANPSLEIPALNITATHVQTLFNNLSDAEIAFNSQESTMDQLRETRDAAMNKLDTTIRAFIGELSLKLGPLDSRWKSFGLNIPGAEQTPDAPTEVTIVPVSPNAAAVKWKAPARAEYYRVWMKAHGSEAEPTVVGTPTDLDFMLENLPAKTTVDIAVSAVNNSGESALSEFVSMTTV